MVIRIRWKKLGGHIHCRVFTSRGKAFTFAKAGDLCFDESEWDAVRDSLNGVVEFAEEPATGFTREEVEAETGIKLHLRPKETRS